MRTITEVSKILIRFYHSRFSGKNEIRYRIKKSDLKKIFGIRDIKKYQIEQLQLRLEKNGYLLNSFDDYYFFIPIKTVDRWRKVPSRLVNDYLSEETEEDE